MLLWLRPWPANLRAQLFWPTQTEARGAFSFWPLNPNSGPMWERLSRMNCPRVANELAAGCPSANNAG